MTASNHRGPIRLSAFALAAAILAMGGTMRANPPASGEMVRLQLTPLQIRNFRLNRVSPIDAKWMKLILDREYRKFGASVELTSENRLKVSW